MISKIGLFALLGIGLAIILLIGAPGLLIRAYLKWRRPEFFKED